MSIGRTRASGCHGVSPVKIDGQGPHYRINSNSGINALASPNREGNSGEIETNHFCQRYRARVSIDPERSSNLAPLSRHARWIANVRAGRRSILTLRRLIAPRINHTIRVHPFSNRLLKPDHRRNESFQVGKRESSEVLLPLLLDLEDFRPNMSEMNFQS